MKTCTDVPVLEADRRYFERFPDRQHRLRLGSRAEVHQLRILGRCQPPEYRLYVAIKCVAPGVRMRRFFWCAEDVETEIDEARARDAYEAAATETNQRIEAVVRRARR
ncbi:hypothetical protein [Mesorhizobium sp.]|uniref:hypothetical protein n=1 Tax=Mesorhizobium sp. TaxID=1871066 RepID=UPI0012089884|nr:hypothetical protein [Mesorhizobium sp.]TIQ46731.1 MAG: hypothetical protein E5X47_23340 [Mesorhizobium sp.]TIQ56504.1 MAG: hypothetical protein E5X46_18705 [Mesorhizobium sp.]